MPEPTPHQNKRRVLRRGKVRTFDPSTGSGVVLTNGGEEVTFERDKLEKIGLEKLVPGTKVQMSIMTGATPWKVAKFMSINGVDARVVASHTN